MKIYVKRTEIDGRFMEHMDELHSENFQTEEDLLEYIYDCFGNGKYFLSYYNKRMRKLWYGFIEEKDGFLETRNERYNNLEIINIKKMDRNSEGVGKISKDKIGGV